jgi:hypothetical protein
MNAQNPDPLDLPTTPECAAALDVLHRWLDREAIAVPPEVAAHVLVCPECGGRFAASGQFAIALIGTETPPPTELADRIVVAVVADGRRRQRQRRWSLAGAGLAAGILAAIWYTRPVPPPPSAPVAPPIAAAPQPQKAVTYAGPPPLDLRQEFTQAGEAVAAITRRAAVDAADASRQLVPDVPPPWPMAIESARPFENTGAALADGFEPVATSARRAARLFWRELSMEDEKK